MEFRHEIVKLDQNLPVRYFFSDDRKPTYVLPHFHSDIEILYLLTGKLCIYRGIHTTQAQPGDILLLNSNEIHATRSLDDHTTAYVIQVSMDFLKTVSLKQTDIGFFVPLRSVLEKEAHRQEETLQNLERLQHTISKFFDEEQADQKYFFLNRYGILCSLLYLLCQYFIDPDFHSVRSNHKDYERITKIDTYLKEHFTEDISLHDIASYCGLTDTYFSRFFKNTFGIPFSRYLCTLRLEKARTDLTTTNYSILTICNSNGFANYQIFTQKFREAYGMTPSEYRKRSPEGPA
ncbi:MAG: AraC family transcriptional regulator [Candidatus Limivivens sp.]|nr:AraC family transcriptional regulator [Candidatus Limivivens sp.]